jgi:hypothetical protein
MQQYFGAKAQTVFDVRKNNIYTEEGVGFCARRLL